MLWKKLYFATATLCRSNNKCVNIKGRQVQINANPDRLNAFMFFLKICSVYDNNIININYFYIE